MGSIFGIITTNKARYIKQVIDLYLTTYSVMVVSQSINSYYRSNKKEDDLFKICCKCRKRVEIGVLFIQGGKPPQIMMRRFFCLVQTTQIRVCIEGDMNINLLSIQITHDKFEFHCLVKTNTHFVWFNISIILHGISALTAIRKEKDIRMNLYKSQPS